MSWKLDALTPTLDTGTPNATLDGSNLGGGIGASLFSWSPAYGSPRKAKFKLDRAPFGDGYEQRSGKGINNIERMWDLRFIGKTEAVALDIQDFLEARSDGSSFFWTPPYMNRNDEMIRVICVEFQVTPASYNTFDITATFQQVYGE